MEGQGAEGGGLGVGLGALQVARAGQPRIIASFRPIQTPPNLMPTTQFDGATVNTQANVYFDGKCVSHGITLADGSKKSVGVILPATLTFNTGAPEVMECVAGSCEYKLPGSDTWVKSGAGERFSVPGNTRFEIRVADGGEPYHYICHFG
jgi:uncharacterized protein YaiE (UPF0345 family)